MGVVGMGMNCALYMELLAHSSMGNEEYHIMASASGLVNIMAGMLGGYVKRWIALHCFFNTEMAVFEYYYICIIPISPSWGTTSIR